MKRVPGGRRFKFRPRGRYHLRFRSVRHALSGGLTHGSHSCRGLLDRSPAAPFVIAAYVGIWRALAVYAFVLSRRAKRTERDLGALKQALVAREEKLERPTLAGFERGKNGYGVAVLPLI